MKHSYGEFSDKQIIDNAKLMHNEVHKLLLYKDPNVRIDLFNSEEDFYNYFQNMMIRFDGLNSLLGYPTQMIGLMSTLQAAMNLCKDNYDYKTFRRLILDAHGYITKSFEEV